MERPQRVCEFSQSKWLRVYIEKHTIMRKQAEIDFTLKKVFKQMSNVWFEETMENLRKRSKNAFVGNVQQAESTNKKPSFKSFNIFNENPVSVSFKSSSVLWDKPTPVVASILDLSKRSHYKFRYEQMISRYSATKLVMAYKDRNSLLYCVETENLNQDMAGFKDLLDMSDYPKDHFLCDPKNKKSL